ncbi:hypothetical protein [Gordonibacter massiliensis (ex Traore et al. 2017)]|uniref:Uncharacterized protein n=1 Tax=Gordonibacter massiliensis (ex Traore et al. 2017) TaxID=1841863 RepID=A0A842JCH9_9ACTN|nr:hypothetical protein [Gordonibacter massiliensis (ex Traore et al. 2017)]MBC2889623.1 hypothetical protein [Gordonibacter massiliensis (ex Traore et al. 2017)]MBX9033176.1 hypothetical protein [Gordonibacter massiliensis (ex Traore et al. 2017)]
MERFRAAVDGARRAVETRPALAAALAFGAAAGLAALLAWFVLFSGLSGPVQFVYSNF